MSFEFLFCPKEKVDFGSLCQGDVLLKNQELIDVLNQAHSYYATSKDYTHFIVLTQSCDLVRRKPTGCKAQYITVAAVKKASQAVQGLLEGGLKRLANAETPVVMISHRRKVEDFIERLLHNTAESLFFVPENKAQGVDEDLCGYLTLSIALRVEHYDALLRAKLCQLSDVFQAKVGWLKGNIYSRVGTPAFEEHVDNPDHFRAAYFEKLVRLDSYFWLSPLQKQILDKAVTAAARQAKVEKLSDGDVQSVVKSVPFDDVEIVAELIAQRLVKNKIIDGDDSKIRMAKNVISNVPELKQIIKENQRQR